MNKKISKIKRVFTLCLIFLFSINTFAAIVSDNDGSAFVTKAEFDALKEDFKKQIDDYNSSIDGKIDGAIASYLAGLQLSTTTILDNYLEIFKASGDRYITFHNYTTANQKASTKNRAGEYVSYHVMYNGTPGWWTDRGEIEINSNNTVRNTGWNSCGTHGKTTNALIGKRLIVDGGMIGFEPTEKYYYSFGHLMYVTGMNINYNGGAASWASKHVNGQVYSTNFTKNHNEQFEGSISESGKTLKYSAVHLGEVKKQTSNCGDWILYNFGNKPFDNEKVAVVDETEKSYFNGTTLTESIFGIRWATQHSTSADTNVDFKWQWNDWLYDYELPSKWINYAASEFLGAACYKWQGLPMFKTETAQAMRVEFNLSVSKKSKVFVKEGAFENVDVSTYESNPNVMFYTINAGATQKIMINEPLKNAYYYIRICPVADNDIAYPTVVGDIVSIKQ